MGCGGSKNDAHSPELVGTASTQKNSSGRSEQELAEEEYQRQLHKRQLQLADHVRPLLQRKESIMTSPFPANHPHVDIDKANEKTKKRRAQESQVAAMQQGSANKSWVVSCVIDSVNPTAQASPPLLLTFFSVDFKQFG